MKGSAFKFGLAVFVCLSMSVLADTVYSFQTVIFPGDTFTQLLGINNAGKIAGYHGSGATGHPNQGFTLTLPNHFTSENFPGSAQTQVIGINNRGNTDGFYIDAAGVTHGFTDIHDTFTTIDFPNATSVLTQLLGLNEQKGGGRVLAECRWHPVSFYRAGRRVHGARLNASVEYQRPGNGRKQRGRRFRVLRR